jgi:hypothetical protein
MKLPSTIVRAVLPAVILVALAALSAPAADRLADARDAASEEKRFTQVTFTETTKDEVLVCSCTYGMAGDYYILRIANDNEVYETINTTGYETLAAYAWYTDTNDEFVLVREGDVLHVTGTYQGEEVNRTIDLEGRPWRGTYPMLKGFVLSDAQSEEFFTYRPEANKDYVFKAIREGVETVTVDGMPVEAWRVRITFPGFKSLFWESHLWFSTRDGALVKTDEHRGPPPSTPRTVVELVDRKQVPPPALHLATSAVVDLSPLFARTAEALN